MYTVDLRECIEKMNLECVTPDVNVDEIKITQSDVNRPALQLAGVFDYFDHHGVPILRTKMTTSSFSSELNR